MSRTVQAIFDKGVLRPLEQLPLRQDQRVVLHIDEEADSAEHADDSDFLEYCRAEGDSTISLDAVRQALAKIQGTMTQACIDERDEN